MRTQRSRQHVSRIACSLALAVLALPAAAGRAPDWVAQRPRDPRHFVGIGSAECKGRKAAYRQQALERALADLASSISLTISATFVDSVCEQTGLLHEDVKSEIIASARATLTGYDVVDEWKSRREYWVYCRYSKAAFEKEAAARRRKAAALSADLLSRARRRENEGMAADALSLYFQSLAVLQDHAGEPLRASVDGTPEVLLFNATYEGALRVLGSLRVDPRRDTLPFAAGRPLLSAPAVRVTTQREPGGTPRLVSAPRPVGRVPVRFEPLYAGGAGGGTVLTDAAGIAAWRPRTLPPDGKAGQLRVRVELGGLYGRETAGGLFEKIVSRLSPPETRVDLAPVDNPQDLPWHHEFSGRPVTVFCVYETGDDTETWSKMQDLLLNLLRGFGARARPGRAQGDRHRLLDYAARRGGGAWDLGDTQGVVLVAAARGKLHRRENPRSPVGEDVRFEGEICCAARKDGTPCFSDRYRGMGGWNPMGAGMAMDVLALHALKRFQAQYLQRLQGTATDSE